MTMNRTLSDTALLELSTEIDLFFALAAAPALMSPILALPSEPHFSNVYL